VAKADLHAGMATAQKDARAVMLKTKLCHEKTGGNETTRSRRSDGCCNCSRALQLFTPPAHRTTVKFNIQLRSYAESTRYAAWRAHTRPFKQTLR
jgi:hypothetical protein